MKATTKIYILELWPRHAFVIAAEIMLAMSTQVFKDLKSMWNKDESNVSTNKWRIGKSIYFRMIDILLSLAKVSDWLSGKAFISYMDPYQFSIFILGPALCWKKKVVSFWYWSKYLWEGNQINNWFISQNHLSSLAGKYITDIRLYSCRGSRPTDFIKKLWNEVQIELPNFMHPFLKFKQRPGNLYNSFWKCSLC